MGHHATGTGCPQVWSRRAGSHGALIWAMSSRLAEGRSLGSRTRRLAEDCHHHGAKTFTATGRAGWWSVRPVNLGVWNAQAAGVRLGLGAGSAIPAPIAKDPSREHHELLGGRMEVRIPPRRVIQD